MKLLLASALLLAPLAVFALDGSPDASFYKSAAEGGLFEVEVGKMAEDKGASQQVKDFGAMMVKDHGAANEKLKAIAAAKGVTLPTSPSVGQMAKNAELDVLSGTTFDKTYIKSQLKAHRETIALFNKEITTGSDADAKAFATATLPTLHAHLAAIEAIAATTGVTS